MSDELEITVTGFVRNEGTIWLLSGVVVGEEDDTVTFACEPRYAFDILQALDQGEEPVALVPGYAVWSRYAGQ